MKKILFSAIGLLTISLIACTSGNSKPSYDDSFSFSEKEPDSQRYYFLTDVYFDNDHFLNCSYSNDFKTVTHNISEGDIETFYFDDEYRLIESVHQINELSINDRDLYEYDSDDNLKKKTSYKGEEIEEFTVYEYENNLLVKKTIYDSLFGLENKYYEVIYEYLNNVYRENYYYLNEETGLLYLDYTDEYITSNKNENTYKVEFYQTSYTDGEERELRSTSIYDTKTDNLIDYVTQYYYEHYQYNEFGNKTYYEIGDIIDATQVPTAKYEILYDENNYISSFNCYEYINNEEFFGLKSEIICDENGVVTQIHEYRINESSQWELSLTLCYEFVVCDIYIPYLVDNSMFCAYYPGNYNLI